ncbi:MAG: TldD/PmbA family protein [Candidatus Spyradocola sp.]|jgi:TldD protein
MIAKNDAARALSCAMRTGADFAEIFVEDVESGALSLLDSRIEAANRVRTRGAGIRVFRGVETAYAYTNDLTPEGLMRCAEAAAAALGTAEDAPSVQLLRSVATNRHPILRFASDVSGRRRADLLRAADAAARSLSPEIRQVAAGLTDDYQRVLIANTEGLFVQDERVHTRLRVTAVAASETENQTGTESPGAQAGFEFIEGLSVEELGRSAARTALTMLRARPCPAGAMPVVIENGFGGVIFHEACGHALEATSVGKDSSVFCGKLGQKIAADCVSAVDDGTIVNGWGSLNIDDEGNPARRNLLIENGVLKGYLIDRLGSRRMGMPMTGSSRRQDYTYAPTSRMTNTFICAGADDGDEMIATMGDGLYAAKMGGGSVNPVTGEFNFAVNEGYLVRDGKIAEPVRGASLIGKGSEILFHIDRVGKNLARAQGVCGSLSGGVPVDVGQPRIRVSNITVGGRERG